MKRRILVIMFILAAFTAASAAAQPPGVQADGLWIGITGLYDVPVALDDPGEATEGEMSFGIDARLRIGLFEGSLISISNPFAADDHQQTMVMLNGGVNFNLQPVILGASLGANYIYEEGAEDPDRFGANAKVSADLMIGDFSIGAYYVSMMDSFDDFSLSEFTEAGYIGLSALYKLF